MPTGDAMRPAPTNPPMSAWVVEMGNPNLVASSTVRAAAKATAAGNTGLATTSGGTNPLPEKVLRSPRTSTSAVTDPSAVVTVAQSRARR